MLKNPRMIWYLNSRKRLRRDIRLPKTSMLALLAFAWLGAWASNQVNPVSINSAPVTVEQLKKEIRQYKDLHTSFDQLTRRWQKLYGTQAFEPLVQIVLDRNMRDSDRYVALMSAAKLGGAQAVPRLLPLLKDTSWMIRGGMLRALSAMGSAEASKAIFPLLKDPALVVRAEAVEAIRVLKPKGAAEALISTLEDEANYHAGKAQWVPQKALIALTELHAAQVAPKLKPLLESSRHNQDPEFKKQILATIAALTP